MTVEHKRTSPARAPPVLVRSLNLPLAVLFGLGVTIGAGIYVLIGATAGRAGMHAPLSFLLAALVMAPTAASFAEFASRMPVSAGEAAYVRAGFGSERLALLIGLMVIAVGVISAAAIAKGSAGYVREFVDLPTSVIITAVVLLMGAVAAWGILQSVAIAGLMTLIEVGGLLVIIFFGATTSPDLITHLPEIWIGLDSFAAVTGVLSASLLAFFAFIGFEGLANIAEEVKDPQRTLPQGDLPDAGDFDALLHPRRVDRPGLGSARRACRGPRTVEPGIPTRHRGVTICDQRNRDCCDRQRHHCTDGDGIESDLRNGRSEDASVRSCHDEPDDADAA